MKKIEEKKKNDSSNGKSFSLTFLLGWLYGLFGVALGAAGAYVVSKFLNDKDTENTVTQKAPTTFSAENENLLCPISQCLMTDPMTIKQCGHTFDRNSILQWLDKQQFCPQCRTHATIEDLVQNFTVKSLVQDAINSKEIKN